jgi:hypothetical protein
MNFAADDGYEVYNPSLDVCSSTSGNCRHGTVFLPPMVQGYWPSRNLWGRPASFEWLFPPTDFRPAPPKSDLSPSGALYRSDPHRASCTTIRANEKPSGDCRCKAVPGLVGGCSGQSGMVSFRVPASAVGGS